MNKYNDFLLNKEFEDITNNIFKLVENGGRFTSDNTYEWDFTKTNKSIVDKLTEFLKKLPKGKIEEYFIKFLNKIKLLPEKIRRKILVNYKSSFLSVVSISFLIGVMNNSSIDKKMVDEFTKVTKNSSFNVSHKSVAAIEGGYSDDKSDIGNYVEFKLNNKMVKRFIGTKYGISAPVLMKYLGHLPKKEDMMNLSYNNALEIYKTKYWDNQDIENFCNQSVATIIYDGCVNQGIGGMKQILRKILSDNGTSINDDTSPFQTEYIKIINSLDQSKVFSDIKNYRKDRYHNTATADEHEDGWINRLEKLEYID